MSHLHHPLNSQGVLYFFIQFPFLSPLSERVINPKDVAFFAGVENAKNHFIVPGDKNLSNYSALLFTEVTNVGVIPQLVEHLFIMHEALSFIPITAKTSCGNVQL